MKFGFGIVLSLLVAAPLFSFGKALDEGKTPASNKQSGQAVKASFLYVNDNYIATWWPDYNDQYFGADDFLTVSFLSRVYWNDWKISTNYTAVTLRKFNTRYDLISSTLNKKLLYKEYIFNIGGGLIYKGNLGGQTLQNKVHRLGSVKPVKMPYSKQTGVAYIMHISADVISSPGIFSLDKFRPFIDCSIISRFIPSPVKLGISYQWEFFSNFQVELLSAYEGYFNTTKEYSSMVRPGIINAIDIKINFYKNYFIDAGFVLIPTKNILTDTIYSPYKNDFLPQAWISFSWDSEWQSLLEHLDY